MLRFDASLFFTERGLARLLAQDYRVTYCGPARHTVKPEALVPVRALETYCNQERRMRLKDQIARAFLKYLEHPCAVPACPCAIHQVHGLPQSDYIWEVLSPKPSAYPRGGVPMFRKPARTR